MSSRTLGLAGLVVVSVLYRLPAQDARFAADVGMVRGLVTELRFIDLARHEVARLKRIHKDGAHFMRLNQLEIDVALQGARRHPDHAMRGELMDDAVTRLQTFLERYSDQDAAVDARRTLVEACVGLGEFLNAELASARESDPQAVGDLEERAAEVFRLGVKTARLTQKGLQARGTREARTEAFVTWLQRGILFREHGRAVKKDRKYLCDTADKILEDLIIEIGEETLLGQKALFERSKIEEVRGDLDAAITGYQDAISAIWEALENPQDELLIETQRVMVGMMQEVAASLANAMLSAGRGAEIDALVKTLDARLREYRAEPDPRWYDAILVTRASFDARSGERARVSDALRKAREINRRHPYDAVGRSAKRLIADVLSSSADLITGELLLQVALGEYQEQDYEAAAASFKRALQRMDAAAAAQHGFDTWVRVARCNEKMQRHLEAALAYSRGVEEYGDRIYQDGGPAAQVALRSAVTGAVRAIQRVQRASKADPFFKALEQRILAQRSRVIPGANSQDYVQALRLKIARKYTAAVARFLRVKPEFFRYELALGHTIDCHFRSGNTAAATAMIARLRAHVNATKLAEDDRQRRGYRLNALAWAACIEARMLYDTAKATSDLPAFRRVIATFLAFERDHLQHAPTQTVKVHEILGHAYLEVGDELAAAARYSKLKALGATRPDAHKGLGILMFNHYRDRAGQLEVMRRQQVEAGEDARATKAKLVTAQRKALDLAIDYGKTVGKPAYAMLYNAMRLAEDLEAWPKVEWAATKILKLYAGKPYNSLRQVKPALGRALMRQPGRLQAAYDTLVAAEKELGAQQKKTSVYFEVLRLKALALGGWPAFDSKGINYEPNPGLGKPAAAFEIYFRGKDFKNWALHSSRAPSYSLPWYQYHLELVYFCRQAAATNAKFARRARTIYNIARATDDFAALKAHGPDGVKLFNLFMQLR